MTDHLDQRLHALHTTIGEQLDALLDLDTGLSEALTAAHHSGTGAVLDRVLDLDAGLHAIVPRTEPSQESSTRALRESVEVEPEVPEIHPGTAQVSGSSSGTPTNDHDQALAPNQPTDGEGDAILARAPTQHARAATGASDEASTGSPMAGARTAPRRRRALLWFVLAAATGINAVTFYLSELMLWAAVTGGFTVVALALASRLGIQARHATNPRNVAKAQPGGRTLKLNRSLRMPRGLRKAMAELQKIYAEPEPDLAQDLSQLLHAVQERTHAAVHAKNPDEQITEAIDEYVDTSISNWKGRMLGRHRQALDRLDVIEVWVKLYLDRSDALHADDLSRLDHLDGAVSHALDRVSDPDTPLMDPLLSQQRGRLTASDNSEARSQEIRRNDNPPPRSSAGAGTYRNGRETRRNDNPPPRSSAGASTDRNGRVIHGDLAQISGQPWTDTVFWFVLFTAAGVDVVTFHQVLLQVMNASEWMLWTAVAGFTVVTLALAHYTGIQARHATNPRNVAAARATGWICFGVWLLLGVTAFVFRYIVAQPVDSGSSVFVVDGAKQTGGASVGVPQTQHLSALLFLTLYIGTGTISALAGFVRHNAAAKQYNRAVNQRNRIARRHAYSSSVLASASQLWIAINRVRARRDDQWANVEAQCDDAARRLKQQARLYLLAVREPQAPPRQLPDEAPPSQ